MGSNLKHCINIALAEVDYALEQEGPFNGKAAMIGLVSNFGKYPETAPLVGIAMASIFGVNASDPAAVRQYIEGFYNDEVPSLW